VTNLTKNQAKYSEHETAAILKSVTPVIRKYAGRYARCYSRFGVEFDDLVQEGMLAVLSLMESRTREKLDHAIRTGLRRMMRDFSERQKEQARAVHMTPAPDENDYAVWLEESIPDRSAEEDKRHMEIIHDLKRCLGGKNREVAVMLFDERSLGEIARALGISKQAVANRVKTIRKRLKHMTQDGI